MTITRSIQLGVPLVLLLLAAVVSQGSAQINNCDLITMASELGNVGMPSDQGIIATALNLGGDNPANPRIQIRDFRITCSVAGTEPDTYQFLSVVVALTCEDDPASPGLCTASVLGGEGNFTAQFELQCNTNGEWVLGDDSSANLNSAFTNPANGTLETPTDEQCGRCYSNQQATIRLDMDAVSYNSTTHCASCDSSCLGMGLRLCSNLGPSDCCSFYHDAGSGFMCVDMCPPGFSPNATFFCIQACPDNLVAPADGTLSYNPMDLPRFEGTVATYDCNIGFTLIGNNNQETRTCTGGVWSGSDPMCVVDCGLLNDLENGEITYSDGTIFGSEATHTCNTGYELQDNEGQIRTCQQNGQWSGFVPTCQIISCPTLESPANGEIHISDAQPVFGSVAIYSCNDGFLLSGTRRQTCQASGTWSSVDPTCIEDNTPQVDFGGFGGADIALIVCAVIIFLILAGVIMFLLLCGSYFKSKE